MAPSPIEIEFGHPLVRSSSQQIKKRRQSLRSQHRGIGHAFQDLTSPDLGRRPHFIDATTKRFNNAKDIGVFNTSFWTAEEAEEKHGQAFVLLERLQELCGPGLPILTIWDLIYAFLSSAAASLPTLSFTYAVWTRAGLGILSTWQRRSGVRRLDELSNARSRRIPVRASSARC